MRSFKVYHEDELGDEPWCVEAVDAEDAARKYAERYHLRADYALGDGNHVTVEVANTLDQRQAFSISMEMVPHYRAQYIACVSEAR